MYHFLFLNRILFKPEGDGAGAGGGAGEKKPEGGAPDIAKEIQALKDNNAKLMAEIEKLKGGGPPPPPPDKDLRDKAKDLRDKDDKEKLNTRALESALKFQLNSENWLKQNATLLPKDVPDIFKAAEKENYDSALEKDSAIKAGIVKSFFSVQSNLDLLTPGLKTILDDYLKLTNNGKLEKAQHIYDTIFEPTFDTLKRVKRAEALNKGYAPGSTDDAYKQKLMKLSKKHFLGEKVDA